MAHLEPAFQNNAFQPGAFQSYGLPAFLGSAFEREAFQVGESGYAFQADAFCGEAFLANGTCLEVRTSGHALGIVYAPEPEDEDGIAAIVAAMVRRW